VFALVAVVAEFGMLVREAPEPECAPENVPAVIVPVTVKDVNVPTLVKDDVTTFAARVVPVNDPAAAAPVIGIVTSAEPLNETPFIKRAVCRVVAVVAFPLKAPVKVVAVTVDVVKFPLASRATIALPMFELEAVVAEFGMLVREAPEPE
jgi:hypothetical protein